MSTNNQHQLNLATCKESEIKSWAGPYYNNTLNHKMKNKDTSSQINPTNGLWPSSLIYKSTNETLLYKGGINSYLDKTYNIKRNPYKTWEEEVQKFKNMGKKEKNKEENKEKEKSK